MERSMEFEPIKVLDDNENENSKQYVVKTLIAFLEWRLIIYC